MKKPIDQAWVDRANKAAMQWGTTAPCLRIAKAFGVDYAVPLYLVDAYLRPGRVVPLEVLETVMYNDRLEVACADVASWTRLQWAIGAQG